MVQLTPLPPRASMVVCPVPLVWIVAFELTMRPESSMTDGVACMLMLIDRLPLVIVSVESASMAT